MNMSVYVGRSFGQGLHPQLSLQFAPGSPVASAHFMLWDRPLPVVCGARFAAGGYLPPAVDIC
jgi:hypothetical protein